MAGEWKGREGEKDKLGQMEKRKRKRAVKDSCIHSKVNGAATSFNKTILYPQSPLH
jgi:hypothetical protein